MRRLFSKSVKPVHIFVHPDFYNRLELEKKKYEKESSKSISKMEFSEILSKSRINFPRVGEMLHEKTKQKRRRY
jgi:hypothetical protein